MEECKKRAQGTKVSKIANIFQGMPSRDDEDMRGSDVTVVRTESHLTRFNNARALFEKLGEENRNFRIEKSPSAASSFAGTRGLPVVPSRSRSSSAGSVSPTRSNSAPTSNLSPAVNGDRLSNGAAQQPPPKPAKPSVLPKPEKPDRRFNKELIEKQRNWTAHFNKSRPTRFEQEQRLDPKPVVGYQDRKSPDKTDKHVPSRVYTPPPSPGACDSHIERPSTLPSIINRGIHIAKSPSPIKNVAPVLPSPRTNNTISPTLRSEILISPTINRDNIYPPKQSPTKTETVDRIRSSLSPELEKGQSDENKEIITKDDNNLQSVEYKSANSPLLPDDVEIHTSFRFNKSPPSPPLRAPKSPPTPIPDFINVTTDNITNTTKGTEEPEFVVKVEEEKDYVDSHQEVIVKSLSSSSISSLPQDGVKENNILETEHSITVTPEIDDVVLRSPTKSQDDDVYEAIQYSGDWNEKSRRRSSTPESPTNTNQKEGVLQSPLASPTASPVHSLPYSTSPAPASPSKGKQNFICNYNV